jgi:hypothetical protein
MTSKMPILVIFSFFFGVSGVGSENTKMTPTISGLFYHTEVTGRVVISPKTNTFSKPTFLVI